MTKILTTLVTSALMSATFLASSIDAKEHPKIRSLVRNMGLEVLDPGSGENWWNFRRDFLFGIGRCETNDHSYLFDRNGNEVAVTDRVEGETENNKENINLIREKYFAENESRRYVSGRINLRGYPWGFSCMDEGIDFIVHAPDNYYGRNENALVREGWSNGDAVFSVDKPITLKEVFEIVGSRFPMISPLSKKMLIGQGGAETGFVKGKVSPQGAYGLMQITQGNLEYCGVEWEYRFNEFAQVYCAHTLFVRAQKKIASRFNKIFGRFPQQKKDQLYADLLARSYHSGENNVAIMLDRGRAGNIARHMANNHKKFTANEIDMSMALFNYDADDNGVSNIGLGSFKYPLDSQIVYEYLMINAEPSSNVQNTPCEFSVCYATSNK